MFFVCSERKMANKNRSIDLDAILEEAVNSQQLDHGRKIDVDVDSGLKIRLVSDEVKPWLAASANVPKEFREKWTKMVKADTETECISKFQPSYSFRAWEGSTTTKNGVSGSLQEIVKKAASTSGIDESKIVRLLTMINPVTDSGHGKVLQKSFTKQIFEDLSKEIKTDPNFDGARFVELNSELQSS